MVLQRNKAVDPVMNESKTTSFNYTDLYIQLRQKSFALINNKELTFNGVCTLLRMKCCLRCSLSVSIRFEIILIILILKLLKVPDLESKFHKSEFIWGKVLRYLLNHRSHKSEQR